MLTRSGGGLYEIGIGIGTFQYLVWRIEAVSRVRIGT